MKPPLRPIRDLAGCRAVVDLQRRVWGEESELVHKSLLSVSIKRGGILIGAFGDGDDELIGFVWSMPGWREGEPTQWSHMLAVADEGRRRGLGTALKLAQRDEAIAAGVALIEWTFDPLQAPNAHLNMRRLGCIATEYRADAYGAMEGVLHRGTPTDRLVAEWWIQRPHVERRLAAHAATLQVRDASLADAAEALEVDEGGPWPACRSVRVDLDARRVLVRVPPDFTRMQREALDLAMAWRLGVREALTAYLARGYRVVDFELDRTRGGGAYLLSGVET